ncbi:probable G-protein coupled receptor No9 [Pocillopora damicornis]|uniref:probable G-protein coupled receptor No9 n=1 Tax=Pocillopora damicornis TaxID=46731 RepID=UPI000F54DE2D|nr:probable G-protein coupled receptor No9 [Pocillopora damicornis]
MNDSLNDSTTLSANISVEDCSLPVAHGIALISTNAFVGLFGTLGNLLVCLAVVIYPRLRRPSNYLLFSLAIADLIVTMACEPLVVAIFTKRTFFNDCALDLELPYVILSMLSCSASVLHMAAISIDRFIAVVFPLHHRAMSDTCGLKAMLITCWAYPISVPILSAVVPPTFPKDIFALLMFAISYGIIFLSYSLIVISLVRHKRQEKQLEMRRNSNTSHQTHVEIRVASTLGIVILVFTACWLPFVVVLYATGRLLIKKHGVAYMWIRTLALSNSAINFSIYGSRMQNFREAFSATGRKVLGAFTRQCSRTQVYDLNVSKTQSSSSR